ncbi:putative ribonuclease H-like superfamily [Helianthus annuus]|nr:putative ribonuclease H-like superfamily [Helianthus annuus]
MNQKKHMDENMKKLTKEEMIANYHRLLGSVMSVRFCLENSLPFRGHDESEESNSQGMFLSVLNLISTNHPEIGKYTLGNAKKNNKLTSPKIQKEIIECFSKEVTKSICAEIKDDVFGLLVDESSDVSLKEQMAVVVRFVDKLGAVRESLIGIVHVKDTTSITLKEAIDDLLASNQLSVKQVRGQGYDGASNMRGEFNGLKALILKDNPSAHYIHCFAHQLQLVIVAVAKKHSGVKTFYEFLSMVVTTVSASCKRKDMLREEKKARVEKELLEGEIKTGKGLNQEVSLARPGDTR